MADWQPRETPREFLPAFRMAGEDELDGTFCCLAKERERLQDPAMVLVRPKIRRIDEEVTGRQKGTLFSGQVVEGYLFSFGGELRGDSSKRCRHKLRGRVILNGPTGVLGIGGDGAGLFESDAEITSAAFQRGGRKELRKALVLHIRN